MTSIPSSSESAMRDAFEAWCETQGVGIKRVTEFPNASYTNYETHLAWEAWQKVSAGKAGLVEALRWTIHKIDAEICTHEDTKRGGAIWTIYQEPPELTAARAALSAKE